MIQVIEDSRFYTDLDMIKQLLIAAKAGCIGVDLDSILKGVENTIARGGKLTGVREEVES